MSRWRSRKVREAGLTKLKYDAATPSKRRRAVVTSTKPADRELTVEQRQRILSQAREIQGNFALAGFLLDKHIQYMASYKFQFKSPDNEFNKAVETLFNEWKSRENCDIAEQFSFDELLQMIELHRTTDGDILIVKHNDLKLQLVEGDRVRNPDNIGIDEDWYHGVRKNDYGKALAYGIARRQDMGGFKFERYVSSRNAWLLGYRRRIAQQRGVSPLSTVVNQMYGLYESFDFALAKERLIQMLGLVTLRNDPDERLTEKQQEEEDDEFHRDLVEAFGAEIAHVALQTGEDLKVVESQNPSQNTQSFWETTIRQILLSLHIPYSFFDGSKTNYYGAKGELNQYLDSCTNRQIPVKNWLHELTFWLVTAWVEDGVLLLPDGWEIEDVPKFIQWSNAGMPLWVLFELVKENYAAILSGAITPQKFANMFGLDYEENIDEIAKAIEYAKSKGVRTSFDMTDRDILPNLSITLGS
jgi:capsid protein